MIQESLFEEVVALPLGLRYQPGFLSGSDERSLIEVIHEMPLKEAEYKQYTARRRVLSFGGKFDFDSNELMPADVLPPVLLPLRQSVANWLGVEADVFAHALVAEYRSGTPLGWHRDVSDFETVVGISLAGDAELQFRPYPHLPGNSVRPQHLTVAPRSLYVLEGDARWKWQHRVLPTPGLRFSITFRTRRDVRSVPFPPKDSHATGQQFTPNLGCSTC